MKKAQITMIFHCFSLIELQWEITLFQVQRRGIFLFFELLMKKVKSRSNDQYSKGFNFQNRDLGSHRGTAGTSVHDPPLMIVFQ